jgi:hypothetical protein
MKQAANKQFSTMLREQYIFCTLTGSCLEIPSILNMITPCCCSDLMDDSGRVNRTNN